MWNRPKGMSGFGIKISLLVYLLAAGLVLYGQETNGLITIHMDQQPMKKVLDRIEQESGLIFSYNSRLIDADEAVSIHLYRVSLEEALSILFAERRISFEVVEQQVVLNRDRGRKVKQEAAQPQDSTVGIQVIFTLSGFVKDSRTGELLIGATITIPGGTVGTITNAYGFYSLTLQSEAEELIFTYPGDGSDNRPAD